MQPFNVVIKNGYTYIYIYVNIHKNKVTKGISTYGNDHAKIIANRNG